MKASLDLGLSFHDAIREFLDNSVDAKATNIHIGLQKIPATDDKSEGTRIFIIDNGTGVPATVTDSDGYTYDGLPYVLSFGGRERSVNVDGTARTIGRFGVGLSSAICKLASDTGHAILYTKTETDNQWRKIIWKYQDILNDDCQLPPEKFSSPPPLAPTKGTVIIIDSYIEEAEKKRVGTLKRNLLKEAETLDYRHRIAEDGLKAQGLYNVER